MRPDRPVIFFAVLLGISTACGCISPLSTSVPASGLSTATPKGVSPAPASGSEEAGGADAEAPGPPYALRELQRLARRRNPRVEELAARVAAAEARVQQSASRFYPLLRSDGVYLRRDDQVAFTDPVGGDIVVFDRQEYTQTTTLNYELWDWGGRRYLYRASLLDRTREEAERTRELQTLDFQVARVLYRVLELSQDLEVLRSSVATLAGDLELAQNLRSAGRSTEADVLVVQVNLERSRYDLRRLEDLVANAREELATLVDLPRGESIELDLPVEIPAALARLATSSEALDSGSWEELALESRAEFRALRSARRALENARRAERSTALPRFNLFVQHEYSSTDSDFRDPNFFSGGVSVGWEIFSGFRTRERMRELDAEARELEARERALRSDLVVDVRRALRALRRAFDGVDVARVSVTRAEENLERVRDLFREGKGSGQEVLEAESLLRAERARAVRARFQVFRAHAALRFAIGLDFDQELSRVLPGLDAGTRGSPPEGDDHDERP